MIASRLNFVLDSVLINIILIQGNLWSAAGLMEISQVQTEVWWFSLCMSYAVITPVSRIWEASTWIKSLCFTAAVIFVNLNEFIMIHSFIFFTLLFIAACGDGRANPSRLWAGKTHKSTGRTCKRNKERSPVNQQVQTLDYVCWFLNPVSLMKMI